MKFKAEIDIMPLATLLDPQGKAVENSMKNIGLPEIDHVRIGRHICLNIDTPTHQLAIEKVELACQKILSNQIMETYSYVVEPVQQ